MTDPTASRQPSVTSLGDLSVPGGLLPPYIPDFTVRAVSDLQYVRIRRAHYVIARRATLIERHQRMSRQNSGMGGNDGSGLNGGVLLHSGGGKEDEFDEDWRRVGVATPTGGSDSGARMFPDCYDAASDISSGLRIRCYSLDPIGEGVIATPRLGSSTTGVVSSPSGIFLTPSGVVSTPSGVIVSTPIGVVRTPSRVSLNDVVIVGGGATEPLNCNITRDASERTPVVNDGHRTRSDVSDENIKSDGEHGEQGSLLAGNGDENKAHDIVYHL